MTDLLTDAVERHFSDKRPSARKLGRYSQWPYVPVIESAPDVTVNGRLTKQAAS